MERYCGGGFDFISSSRDVDKVPRAGEEGMSYVHGDWSRICLYIGNRRSVFTRSATSGRVTGGVQG